MVPEKIDEAVVRKIDDVIRARMERWGCETVRVKPDLDHDGDPIIRVDVDYRLMEEPLDSGATFDLLTEVWFAIEKLGEHRFPHVRHHFHERQTTMKYTRPAKRTKLAKRA